ncbi:MAG: type II secretion system protein, partial [Planctomycetota bacterium JB042]
MNSRARGFTLIELLTAIAIFTVLAGMLFQMLKGGLDIWRQGEGNRQALEKGA